MKEGEERRGEERWSKKKEGKEGRGGDTSSSKGERGEQMGARQRHGPVKPPHSRPGRGSVALVAAERKKIRVIKNQPTRSSFIF